MSSGAASHRIGPGVLVVPGWLGVLSLVVVALATIGDRPVTVLVYAAVWLVSTTVPGVLIWRALSRPTTVVQEVGFGSVLGVGLLLLAWVPATLLGAPLLMWLWPFAVVVVFVAVPGLRGHWWPRRAAVDRTPARWHAAMMVVGVLAFLRVWAADLRPVALPPRPSTVFQDVWYQLGLAQRLSHAIAIHDPAVAGVPLNYHWFSVAHATATQQLSGASLAQVVMHLWLVPMLFTYVVAIAAATERILGGSGAVGRNKPVRLWWPGPLAGLLVAALPVTLFLGYPRLPAIDDGFMTSSPSGVLALTVVLALVGPVLDLLDGRSRRGTWVVAVALLMMSAGTKPSILPVVLCGSALAALVQWTRTKRFPTVPVILTGLPLLLIPVAALTVTGSTGGSRVQLFATLSLDPALGWAAGTTRELPGHGGLLSPDLTNASAATWAVAAGLLLLFVLTELPRLLGILGVRQRAQRADLGTWWCAGVVLAGFCGQWVLAHPGYSQHYFWRIVIGLAMVLTVTSCVRLVTARPVPRAVLPELAVLLLAGLVVGTVIQEVATNPADSVPARLLPYGVAAAVLLGLLLVGRLVRSGGLRGPVLVLVTCFCVTTGLPATAVDFEESVVPALAGVDAPAGPGQRYLTGDEQEAALWLGAHSAAADVVATNVFCAPPAYHPSCPHVAFWVAALTGRQLYLGAWAYTEQSLRDYAYSEVNYQRKGSPWPDRLLLSLRAIRTAQPDALAELRAQGADWIFADLRATTVSPELRRHATLRYANADVRVYQIR